MNLGAELARVLADADAARAALAEEVKARRGRIAALEKRALDLRARLLGEPGQQTDIEDVLGEARGVALRAVEPEGDEP